MTTTIENRVQVIQRAFDSPVDSLGTVERNTEIKIVFLMLWELGWDPVLDIASCFQIERSRFSRTAKAALAADFALRDEIGLCAVGEVKHWNIPDRDWPKAVAQAKEYQTAVGAPRAFISSGRRWTTLDDRGNIAYDFTDTNVELLLKKLWPLLGKGTIRNQMRDQQVWKYGICPTDPTLRIR